MSESSSMIEFGQVLFGDNGTGQTERLAQCGPYDSLLFNVADLPETLPVEYAPPPHYSLGRFGDLFAFAKTALDPTQRRTGMVRTHVLTAPVDAALAVRAIRPVLDALDPSTDLDTVEAGPISLDLAPDLTPSVPLGGDALLAAVMARYGRRGAPVVWVGLDSFTEALCYVWGALPLAVRGTLSVRLGLQAQNVYTADRSPDRTRIITVPKRMAGSWDAASIVGPDAPPPPQGPFLTFLRTGEGPLRELLGGLNLELSDTDDYPLLDRAAALYSRVVDADQLDLDELLQLGEIGGRLAPSLSEASEFRRRVGAALLDAAEQDGGDRVRNLRNFDASAYADGARVLATAARAWAVRALIDAPRVGDAAVAELAFTSQSEAWNRVMRSALQDTLGDPRSASVTVDWFAERDDLLPTIGYLVAETDVLEDAYAAAVGTNTSASALVDWARTRGWAVLYAQCLSLTRSTDDALASVSELQAGRVDEALGRLVPKASDAAIVAVAVETGRPFLIGVAAQRCADAPDLLTELDLTQSSSQAVWLGAIEARGGMSDVGVTLLCDLLDDEEKSPVASPILGELIDRAELTLFDYERLGVVLDRLPRSVRERVMSRTADAWVARFTAWASGDGSPLPNADARTARAVAQNHDARSVIPISADLGAIVSLFEAVPDYTEALFVRVLRKLFPANRDPGLAEAKHLGRFVARRKWKSAASTLREYAGYQHAYGPAYAETDHLFGLLERLVSIPISLFRGGTVRLNRDDWWRGLEELCARYYREGVKQRSIIEEAGGDLSDMKLEDKTGKEQWRHVVSGLRKGRFGFDAGDLLQAMSTHYPKSAEVSKMLDLYTDYIS